MARGRHANADGRPAAACGRELGAQKVGPTPTRVSRTQGRFGRTSPSVRPHGGPHSRLVRPVAWQLARRSPHTTPCCCNARQGCHSQPTQEQAFGVPSITVCPFAPTAAESHFNRHPTKSIINHAAPPPPFGVQCSALRQTRDCMYVGVACQWSSRTSFYSLDHVCSTRHGTHNVLLQLWFPTFQPYCLLRYCCCSFISTSAPQADALLPRFQCGCEKVSHTVRVRVARKR